MTIGDGRKFEAMRRFENLLNLFISTEPFDLTFGLLSQESFFEYVAVSIKFVLKNSFYSFL
jgi:hypothetical protein